MKNLLTILFLFGILYAQTDDYSDKRFRRNVQIDGKTTLRSDLDLTGNALKSYNVETVDTIPNVATSSMSSIVFNLATNSYYQKIGSEYQPIITPFKGDFKIYNDSVDFGAFKLPFAGVEGVDYGNFKGIIGALNESGDDYLISGYADFLNNKFNALVVLDTSFLSLSANKDLNLTANEDLNLTSDYSNIVTTDSLKIGSFGKININTNDTIYLSPRIKSNLPSFVNATDADTTICKGCWYTLDGDEKI